MKAMKTKKKKKIKHYKKMNLSKILKINQI